MYHSLCGFAGPLWFDHLWSALKHATIATVVWHRGLLGMFLKQRLSVSDYATYPFDFHKLFTLQKLWQRLLSCAKAFTYVVCLENAAAVIAIILQEKERKRERKEQTGRREACLFLFSCVVSILFVLWVEKKPDGWRRKNGNSIDFPYSKENGANILLHSYAKVSFFFLLMYLWLTLVIMCLMCTILFTHGLLLVSSSLVSGSVAVSLRDGPS